MLTLIHTWFSPYFYPQQSLKQWIQNNVGISRASPNPKGWTTFGREQGGGAVGVRGGEREIGRGEWERGGSRTEALQDWLTSRLICLIRYGWFEGWITDHLKTYAGLKILFCANCRYVEVATRKWFRKILTGHDSSLCVMNHFLFPSPKKVMGHSLHWVFSHWAFEIWIGQSHHVTLH